MHCANTQIDDDAAFNLLEGTDLAAPTYDLACLWVDDAPKIRNAVVGHADLCLVEPIRELLIDYLLGFGETGIKIYFQ